MNEPLVNFLATAIVNTVMPTLPDNYHELSFDEIMDCIIQSDDTETRRRYEKSNTL